MNRHFAELGDVWKHLPLAEILRIRPPLHYWETHAGSESYELSESPARLHGALAFLYRAPQFPELDSCNYFRILKSRPGVYPGSPAIAMQTLRKRASYVFCDTDPESAATLRDALAGFNGRVSDLDGVSEILRESQASTANPEDVLVFIDPYDPFERVAADSKTPIELAAMLANAHYRVVYWYGYDESEMRGWAMEEIAEFAPDVRLWCGDMLMPKSFVYPEEMGAWGCGVVLANGCDKEVKACMELGRALEAMHENDTIRGNAPDRMMFTHFSK